MTRLNRFWPSIVDNGIAEAAQHHASLILITMDTPGGLSTSMEDIIRHILDSPVPVAVYISPSGSRGASAGFFILMSADIAAMAPRNAHRRGVAAAGDRRISGTGGRHAEEKRY